MLLVAVPDPLLRGNIKTQDLPPKMTPKIVPSRTLFSNRREIREIELTGLDESHNLRYYAFKSHS